MIPVSSLTFLGREQEYVNAVMTSGQLSAGPWVERLEEEFAKLCGTKHAIACSSGTSALHLILLGLDVKPGDGVFVPAISYIATANAVRYCSAEPVFVDIDPRTWTMDSRDAPRAAVQARGRGLRIVGSLPVHLYGAVSTFGYSTDLNTWNVEDACQAVGASCGSLRVGGMSRAAAFSFYGNKIIACGEGGIVTTDNDQLAASIRLFRGQGMISTVRERYWHPVIGYNYRMTELQAAIAVAQLEMLGEHITRRDRIANRYAERLAGIRVLPGPDGIIQTQASGPGRRVWWLFTVKLPARIDRLRVEALLKHDGIETRPGFSPLHQQPPYNTGETLSVAEEIGPQLLSLPTHAGMSMSDADFVCDKFLEAVS